MTEKIKYDSLVKFEINKNFKIGNNTLQFKSVDLSTQTINLITKWRKKYWYAFGTKFNITLKSSRNWINQIIDDPNRKLYIVIVNGNPVGNIGFKNLDKSKKSVEIDNVLKGESNYPGIMKDVVKIFISQLFKNMKLSTVWLKVFSDNYKAINAYEQAGMKVVGNVPLKRIRKKYGYEWKKIKLKKYDVAERYFLIMKILR